MKPVACHLWTKETITQDDLDLERVKLMQDTTLFSLELDKCRRCGQLYMRTDCEYNDMISTAFFPVSEEQIERIDFMKGWSDKRIARFKPVLQWYGEDSFWWKK